MSKINFSDLGNKVKVSIGNEVFYIIKYKVKPVRIGNNLYLYNKEDKSVEIIKPNEVKLIDNIWYINVDKPVVLFVITKNGKIKNKSYTSFNDIDCITVRNNNYKILFIHSDNVLETKFNIKTFSHDDVNKINRDEIKLFNYNNYMFGIKKFGFDLVMLRVKGSKLDANILDMFDKIENVSIDELM